MAEQYYYIDPAALSYLPEFARDEFHVKNFLTEFIKLRDIIASRPDCHFLMECSVVEQLCASVYSTNATKRFIPLDTNEIQNKGVKSLAEMARDSLVSILSQRACFIEMQYCEVDQGIIIGHANAGELQDVFYGDYIYLMLGNECFNCNSVLHSNNILTMPGFTRLTGDRLRLDCKCAEKEFGYTLKLVPYHQLENSTLRDKEELYTILRKAGFTGKNYCNKILTKQASHEPVIGHTVVKKYADIPVNVRTVLDELRFFGLQQLDLREWGSHNGPLGSLHHCEYAKPDTSGEPDCIKAWLIIEDRSCRCLMFFPCGVGKLILALLNDKLEAKAVRGLKEEIFN